MSGHFLLDSGDSKVTVESTKPWLKMRDVRVFVHLLTRFNPRVGSMQPSFMDTSLAIAREMTWSFFIMKAKTKEKNVFVSLSHVRAEIVASALVISLPLKNRE